MLQILLFLLPGVLSDDWGVKYPQAICAARGSNVTVACTFTIKSGNGQVTEVKWCSMNSNSDRCLNRPYVYDSEANNDLTNFQYIGDKSSNCSLLINDIKLKDSGEYKFRIITNSSGGMWTGDAGVKISVSDLKVSMSRINGSTITEVNLTCSLNCSGGLSEVQWFKNGELMKQTNPILIFNNFTAEDSGKYSCSLRNFTNTLSEQISINIEDSSILLIIVVSSVSLVFIIIAAVILIRRRKSKSKKKLREVREGTSVSHDNVCQATTAVNESQEDEVLYTSVSVKPKEADIKPQEQTSANTGEQNESIYSAVKTA